MNSLLLDPAAHIKSIFVDLQILCLYRYFIKQTSKKSSFANTFYPRRNRYCFQSSIPCKRPCVNSIYISRYLQVRNKSCSYIEFLSMGNRIRISRITSSRIFRAIMVYYQIVKINAQPFLKATRKSQFCKINPAKGSTSHIFQRVWEYQFCHTFTIIKSMYSNTFQRSWQRQTL